MAARVRQWEVAQQGGGRLLSLFWVVALILSGGCTGGGGGVSSGITPLVPPDDRYHREMVNYETAKEAVDVDGSGVELAIVDSGINARHRAFTGVDVKAGAGHGEAIPLHDQGQHGTHVASLAASPQVGIASGVTLRDHAVEQDYAGWFKDEALAAAFDALAKDKHAVDVANFSLGPAQAGKPSVDFEQWWIEQVGQIAENQDTVIVFAAGNEPDEEARGVAANTNDSQLQGQVIAVGGVDRDGNPQFSIPATDDGSKARFLSAPSDHVYGANAEDVDAWVDFSGTSMAAPQVAGAAALVRERWQHLDAKEVINVLINTADDSDFGGDYDSDYGYGILDVHAALTADIDNSTTLTTTQIDSAADSPRLAATWLQLPPAAGNALAEVDALAEVTVADPLQRTAQVDLRPAAQTAPGFAPEERLGRLLGVRRHERESVAGGEQLMYRNGAHWARGFSSDYGFGYAVSEFGGNYPAPYPAVRPIGPRVPLLGHHDRLSYTVPGEQGWMSSAWAPLGERWHLQTEAFHRAIRPGSGPVAAEATEHAVGARAGVQYTGDGWAAQLDLEHGQRPDAWGLRGSGGLDAGKGDTEQAAYTALEYQWGENMALHGRASVRRLQIKTPGAGLIEDVSDLVTAAARVGIEHRRDGTRSGIVLAWPERVEAGEAQLRVPARVTEKGRVRFTETSASLSPSGRMRELEAYWHTDWQEATVFVNGLLQHEPRHRSGADFGWAAAMGGSLTF